MKVTERPPDASARATFTEPSVTACADHKEVTIIPFCLCKLSTLSESYFELECRSTS